MDNPLEFNGQLKKFLTSVYSKKIKLAGKMENHSKSIPNEKNPDVTLNNLKTYYESLSLMLNKYKTEHPSIKN